VIHEINPKKDDKNLFIILEKMERLHYIKDIHSLLDNILLESREFTNSDAGSIFLVEDNKLKFSYVQNDTIFNNDILTNKYIYSNREIEINEQSIAGYVAKTGNPLLIDDVYNLHPNEPYSFNAYFDEISAYRTQSMLVVPLKTNKGEVVGVVELINSRNKHNKVVSFTEEYKLFVVQFAYYAAVAIERALMVRDIVLRMINLAELRDPEETQAHVSRVGAYSIELYQKWAELHNVPKSEVSAYKDILRISSILHDVGKVGITDKILKKKDKLTDEEYNEMKLHTVYGARLFKKASSEWESLALEIALNHHEKWDGTGYPGPIKNIFDSSLEIIPGKKAREIPLSARIVALADVFDALINKRTYKDPWEEDKVLYYIKQQSGKHFDPELVSIFFNIYDVIKAIRDKWS